MKYIVIILILICGLFLLNTYLFGDVKDIKVTLSSGELIFKKCHKLATYSPTPNDSLKNKITSWFNRNQGSWQKSIASYGCTYRIDVQNGYINIQDRLIIYHQKSINSNKQFVMSDSQKYLQSIIENTISIQEKNEKFK